MKKRMRGGAVVAAVMLLTGCGAGGGGSTPGGNGSNGGIDDRYVGLPDGHDLSTILPDAEVLGDEPIAVWLVPGESFAVVTWGSSSCLPTATAIGAQDAASVAVTFASPNSSGPCTADMAPTTHEFSLPPAATDRPLQVTIRWEDYDEVQVSTLD